MNLLCQIDSFLISQYNKELPNPEAICSPQRMPVQIHEV